MQGFPDLTRRAFLASGAAGVAALTVAPAKAQPAVPEVDSLTLQVLVDNDVFGPFLSDIERPGLKLRRGSGAVRPVMPRRALQAEFGLALLATSRRDGETAQLLIDFGYSPETVRNNLDLLGIDLAGLDAAVLSHGHLDHYGGFTGFFPTPPATPSPAVCRWRGGVLRTPGANRRTPAPDGQA